MLLDHGLPKAVAAAVMLAWAVAAVAPRPAAAFTLIERSLVFAPVELTSNGQTAKVCVTNFGDGSANAVIAIIDAANTSNVLARSTPMIAAGGNACLTYSNSPTVTGAAAAGPTPVEISALIGLLSKGSPSALTSLVSSLTVEDTATQANRVLLLPAVQLPIPVPGG